MIIAIVVLAAISIFSMIICFSYRRRIKKICRQLKYINTHETNMIVSSSYGDTPDTELANEINNLIFRFNELTAHFNKKENNLKDMITSLSHDIRTPLTSLDGYFQLLNESDSQEEKERYIVIIRERISSLGLLLEELFTYAKLQDESYHLEMEYIELNKLLYETVFSFYDEFKQKQIEPEIEITERPVTVYGNYTALKRAMQNIIKNSLEHGQLYFSLTMETKENSIVIRCKNRRNDTDKIDIEHVFNRFYKADAARKHTSTGLGLAIAKEIVEKLEGKIEARIEADVFIIEIQLSKLTA